MIEAGLVFLMLVNVVTLGCVALLAVSQERMIDRITRATKLANATLSRVNVVSKFAHRHNVKKGR